MGPLPDAEHAEQGQPGLAEPLGPPQDEEAAQGEGDVGRQPVRPVHPGQRLRPLLRGPDRTDLGRAEGEDRGQPHQHQGQQQAELHRPDDVCRRPHRQPPIRAHRPPAAPREPAGDSEEHRRDVRRREQVAEEDLLAGEGGDRGPAEVRDRPHDATLCLAEPLAGQEDGPGPEARDQRGREEAVGPPPEQAGGDRRPQQGDECYDPAEPSLAPPPDPRRHRDDVDRHDPHADQQAKEEPDEGSGQRHEHGQSQVTDSVDLAPRDRVPCAQQAAGRHHVPAQRARDLRDLVVGPLHGRRLRHGVLSHPRLPGRRRGACAPGCPGRFARIAMRTPTS
ncbi:hypothetical protein CISG_10382 [Coccidioides immitis RMSCC 3703]|uniref:Uncharacterized protein n=1 Tax=Coccidioides immitis RMSCC 3703 TaxID=454286 RepID=A0A0J8QRZ0_COCIT|nr:hypothetical protein CISG_10382 [Coccidioides immitis RMSCC 3703]